MKRTVWIVVAVVAVSAALTAGMAIDASVNEGMDIMSEAASTDTADRILDAAVDREAAEDAVAGFVPMQTETEEQKPIVYATFYPYYQFAKGVAGEAAEVRQLLPRGAHMHGWEPNYRDLTSMSGAIAFVFSNTYNEPYVTKLQASSDLTGVTFVSASPLDESDVMKDRHEGEEHDEERHEGEEHDEERHEGEEHDEERHEGEEHDEERHEGEEHEGHSDEVLTHTWLNPVFAIDEVEEIRVALVEIDPDNAQVYNENAARYAEELSALDAEFKGGLAECERRTMVTLHNAFGELAERYDLDVLGLSLTHHAEATPSQLGQIIEYAKESGASAIFADDTTDQRREMAAAEEIGIGVVPISTLEGLSRDDADGTSYFEKMRGNLESLREVLGCT